MPPGRVIVNFETGTSGTRSKVVRMPPLKLSMRPTRSTSTWPCEMGDEVRQRVVGRAQVDRPFERLAEQRRDRPRLAVDRFLRAVVGGELDPGADLPEAGLVEEERVRQGDRGAGRCWRRPACALRIARRRGCLARLVAPKRRRFSFGRKPSGVAVVQLDRVGDREGREGRRIGRVGAAALEGAGGGQFRAVGPVEGEFVPVDVDGDRADVELGAAEDVRDRVGDGVDLRRFGIEEERHPDDDGAEVEGPGERRGDDHERERRALVGAGEVGLAVDLQRRGAGAGGDRGDADLALVGTARRWPSRPRRRVPPPRRSPAGGQ